MTRDHDRKDLVRKRMAKTGESYATARRQLFGEAETIPTPQVAPGAPGVFRLPPPEIPDGVVERSLQQLAQSQINVDDRHLSVALGDPVMFEVSIPRDLIVDMTQVPDNSVGPSLGVHGGRGKWLVNTTATGLVRIRLSSPVRASLRIRAGLPDGTKEAVPLLLRPLLRDRRPKVRELTLSVEHPETLLACLRQG